jgi:ribose-phosphate pyrophosphokinase
MIKIFTGPTSNDEVSQFVFNDGSVNVKIATRDIDISIEKVFILAQLNSPIDQMALVLTVNAIRQISPTVKIFCFMPFVPYGRQDSVFVPGEANGMMAWAELVNSLRFETVFVLDPHSNAFAFLDRCSCVDIIDLMKYIDEDSVKPFMRRIFDDENAVIVSPDAGANKKSLKLCKEFGLTEMIRADKAREPSTGKILETIVYGDVKNKTCVIVDDIADGGATFVYLARELKAKGAEKVILFVTHGLFTKGLGVFEGLIDEVHTTGSVVREVHENDASYTGTFTVHVPNIVDLIF